LAVKRATIGDVAAHAGVSTATVSRVLNGAAAVAGPTASRVWQAVAHLDYSPNALTRSIFAGRASTIGVVIRDLASPFYLDLIRGVDEVAAAGGSLVMLANTFRRADREVAQVRALDEQRVRGLIATAGEASDNQVRRLAASGTPCVLVARTLPDPPPGLHAITLDDHRAGRLMGDHLAALGRTSVATVISGPRPSQVERAAGLRQALAARDLAGRDLTEPLEAAAEDPADVADAVAGLVAAARARGRPLDAVACMTGRLAVAVHSALRAHGLAIPADVAFITMDEFPWAPALGITTVTQPAYDMGRRAAELILTPPATATTVVHTPVLIPRTSCGEPSS
jgi:LacI family transcriptional regulator